MNVLFTKCTEEWNDLMYIITAIVHNIYIIIIGLYCDDYSYVITIYHLLICMMIVIECCSIIVIMFLIGYHIFGYFTS